MHCINDFYSPSPSSTYLNLDFQFMFINFANAKHICFAYIKTMGRPHLLKSRLKEIESFFKDLPVRSFTHHKLSNLLNDIKLDWGISYSKSPQYIIDFLTKNEFLFKTEFLNNPAGKIAIYSWKSKDDFTVISGLKNDSYFMYYSSLYLHGLTQQIPKVFYLNAEHSSNETRNHDVPSLSQEGIDKAFSGEQRKSSHSLSLGEKKIIITNSKNTGGLGIMENKNDTQLFCYTDLEKTLIDIVVRPVYSGGVFEILQAYKLARGKLHVKKMSKYLKHLNYIYPYAQAIGFYLEKAGYTEEDLSFFDVKKPFTFYLTYNLRNKEFSKRWNLFYPKGF
jgi:hypothetical protein